MLIARTSTSGTEILLLGNAQDFQLLCELTDHAVHDGPFGLLLKEFLVMLLFDSRRAFEKVGSTAETAMLAISWPVFLLQMWLILLSARSNPPRELLRLFECAGEALASVDPSVRDEVFRQIGEWPEPPDEFLGFFAWEKGREFGEISVSPRERLRKLPHHLETMDSMSREFRAFKRSLFVRAAQAGIRAEDLVGYVEVRK